MAGIFYGQALSELVAAQISGASLSRNIWSWDLDDTELEPVRLEMGQKGRLVAFKVRVEPEVHSRLP